jgi:hypothetical protein
VLFFNCALGLLLLPVKLDRAVPTETKRRLMKQQSRVAWPSFSEPGASSTRRLREDIGNRQRICLKLCFT